ncbi:MAG: hypothetical protein ABIA76_05550 [Candidatus Diapherotrites archaeon]
MLEKNKKKFLIAIAVILVLIIGVFVIYQLLPIEQKIKGKYDEELRNRLFLGQIYHCVSEPEIIKVQPDYVTLKKDLFFLDTRCYLQMTGYYGPPPVLPNYYAFESNELIFFEAYKLNEYFNELFSPLETKEQAQEFITLDRKTKLLTYEELEEELPEWANGLQDCNFVTEMPNVNKTVSKTINEFIYEGFTIQKVGRTEIYYSKFELTPYGEMIEVEDKLIADCGEGIIY